jgi:ribosomal subunit interface protein
MAIIIKGIGVEVAQDVKFYIEEKISDLINKLKEPTVCEITLHDINGPKGGIDKEVRAVVTTPSIKNPVFVSDKAIDFFKAVDLVGDKLKRALHKASR